MAEERAATLNSSRWQQAHFDKYSPNAQRQYDHQHQSSKLACPRPARQQWVTGGPGMHAFFLHADSTSNKSCGTGVFLPQMRHENDTKLRYAKKPAACSPVLLPSRVVQALNLNTHELATSRNKKLNEFSLRKKKVVAERTREEVPPSSHTFSECFLPADIFLPKEWTY